MKSFFIEFKNSFYNPGFYKELPSKDNTHIFKFLGKVSVFFGIISTVLFFIGFIFFVQPSLASTTIVALLIGGIASFLVLTAFPFIVILVYSYILALIVWLVTFLNKKNIGYDASHKISVYVMISSETILVLMRYILSLADIQMSDVGINTISVLVPLIVFFINYKKELRDIKLF